MVDDCYAAIKSRQADGYAGTPFKFPALNEFATIERGELFIFGAEQKQGKLSFYKHFADGYKYLAGRTDEECASVVKYAKEHDLSIEDEFFTAFDKGAFHLLSSDLFVTSHSLRHIADKYTQFHLGSVKMCKDLSKYGAVPNKTHVLKFPDVEPALEIPLIRGMFEGDGGLTLGTATRFCKHRNKSYTSPYQELSFTGTYDMCIGFQRVIVENTNIPEKVIGENHSVYRVRWSNRDEVLKILDLLYSNCCEHFLKRKYDLYQILKERGECA